MSDVQTVKCNICGRPYKFYAFMAGDQSACPSCRSQAEGYDRGYTSTSINIPINDTCPCCGKKLDNVLDASKG